ncbi:tectonic-2-like [Ruditapes philippinarum]|uniref:tectonic-2-like n=1 Tax=Ruditapes philippinarum TaxID=129788 RepID=UPI00295B1FB1|nr:tectonic-2-like [Ruditapes philippinarum]
MTPDMFHLFIFLLTFTPVITQNTAQTVIANAAFEDVAPCPCDLTKGSCDIRCCCDGDCSSDEKQTFDRCIPFLPGGQSAEDQQYECSSKHHNKPDWFPFLCVVFEYNAFLGYFYDWQYKLAENGQALLNRLYTRTFYWYRLCSQSSVLSVLSYINKINNISVLAGSSSIVPATTTVVYKCATDVSSYLKSTQTINDLVDNTQVYKFNYNLPTGEQCVDDCAVCDNFNDSPNTDTPINDCPSQTPTTSLDANGVCLNAVIDVDYTIKWTGNTTEQLDAVITLGNIPIQNAAGINNVLTQKYKTTFIHNVTAPGDGATDNFNNITDASYERSGRVGYDIGRTIFTGYEILNTTLTPPQFMYVNTNSSRQMAVFDTSADGLCRNAGRRSIKFQEDITTRCKLMLNHAEFSDCSGLRKLIINRLNNLMPSNLIGRRGYNDNANRGYWLEVLRDDLKSSCDLSEYFPLGLSPVDNRTGICYNITDGIHLQIFYGVTGKSNGFPIYEILGSKVR